MKRAIIVGNGGCLLNSENGHAIDDFDVVIRFNDFRISGYEKYAGYYVGEKPYWFNATNPRVDIDKESDFELASILYNYYNQQKYSGSEIINF
jgi:hypothetical protein